MTVGVGFTEILCILLSTFERGEEEEEDEEVGEMNESVPQRQMMTMKKMNVMI